MRPNLLEAQQAGVKSYCKLFDQCCNPGDLLLLAKADALGCGTEKDYTPTERTLRRMLKEYETRMSRPFVQGADLVEAGFQPGKDFAEALQYAHRLRVAGVEKKAALRQTAAFLSKLREK